jgi:hypothetical protein
LQRPQQLAESIDSIIDADPERTAALTQTLEQFRDYLTKSYDEDDGDTAQRFSQMFSNPRAAERALAYIIAARQRLRKSSEDTSKTREELKAERDEQLRAIVKAHGITALAKGVVAGLTSIDEHELTALATEHAQRAHPDLSPAQAFEKVYLADATLREAISMAKAAETARYFETVYPMPQA